MLSRGDSLPHFEVTTVAGGRVSYSTIWQHRPLALIVLPEPAAADAPNIKNLCARIGDFRAHDAECVVTTDAVPGVNAPAAVVADKWGEIAFAVQPALVSDLPGADSLLEWVEYLRMQCPECEGEVR